MRDHMESISTSSALSGFTCCQQVVSALIVKCNAFDDHETPSAKHGLRADSAQPKLCAPLKEEEEEVHKLRSANKTDHLCQSWQKCHMFMKHAGMAMQSQHNSWGNTIAADTQQKASHVGTSRLPARVTLEDRGQTIQAPPLEQ